VDELRRGLVVVFGHGEGREAAKSRFVDGQPELRNGEAGIGPFGDEEEGAAVGVVAELDEEVGFVGPALLLAAREGLGDPVEPLGWKRLEGVCPFGRRNDVPGLAPLCSVREPSLGKVDAGPRVSVVVEVDQATGRDVVVEIARRAIHAARR